MVWTVDLHQKFVGAVDQLGIDSKISFSLFCVDCCRKLSMQIRFVDTRIILVYAIYVHSTMNSSWHKHTFTLGWTTGLELDKGARYTKC